MAVNTQSGPYIPTPDLECRQWMNQWVQIVGLDSLSYGISAEELELLSTLAQTFSDALDVSLAGPTRNSGSIGEKDVSRGQAEVTFRYFSQRIKETPGVTEQQKLDIGLHLDDNTKTSIDPPTTYPLLQVLNAENGIHEIRFADSETPDAKRKPPGATSLLLYRILSDQPSADIESAQFVGVFTRNPIQVTYGPEDAGKSASYYAKWANGKGEEGPWGPGVAMTIAFGVAIELQSAA